MKDSSGKISLKRLYVWILSVMVAAALIVSGISSLIASRTINSYREQALYGDALQDGYETQLEEFCNELYEAGFAFYYLLQQENSKYKLTPAGVFWPNQTFANSEEYSAATEDIGTEYDATTEADGVTQNDEYAMMNPEGNDYRVVELSRMIKSAYATFLDSMNAYNMHYLVVSEDLQMSDVESVSSKTINQVLDEKGFFIRVHFRADGTMSVYNQDTHCNRNINRNIQADNSEILSWIKEYSTEDAINFMNPMSIYVYSDSDQYYQDIESSMYRNMQTEQQDIAIVFGYMVPAYVICLLAIIGAWVLMGIKSLGFRNSILAQIPFEGSVVFALLSLGYIAFAPTCFYMQFIDYQTFHIRVLPFVLNTLVALGCMIVLFIAAAGVAQVVIIKPKRYLKERSICVRLGYFLWKKCKCWYRNIKNEIRKIVTEGRYHRAIFLVVLGNACGLAIVIFICFLVFGILSRSAGNFVIIMLVLLIYSVFLYRKAVRYADKISGQYDYLKRCVQTMADGNLSVDFSEDAGMFEPVVENLSKIRDGVRVAVEEEVRSQKMKTELITNVSHDLKTPLTAIITYVNLLKEDNISDEDRKKYIDVLDIKSHRLKKLIEDLFEVSKADSGNVKVELSNLDVLDLIRQVLFEYEDKLNEAKIQVRLQFPNNKIMWMLDGQKMYRIFDNLIGNIVKYSVPGTRAYITVNVTDNVLVMTTKNVSEQELPEDVSSFTDRFVRGEASRHTEGSGLGLAIVQSFAELQGGTFRLSVDGDLFKTEMRFEQKDK